MKRYIVFLFIMLSVTASAQKISDLKECIETGLENNYDVRIIKNTKQISDNNLHIGNAGYLPTVDLNAGYTGGLNNVKTDIEKNTNVNTGQLSAGISVDWMVFDGFSVQTNYNRLKELQQMGELNTRLTIENFIAELSAEYYNYVQQNIRLKNLKSAVKLSKERLRIVEARYTIGSMSRLDLQQARVDFNADSSKLIRQQETLFASRVKLNHLMAIQDIESPLAINDTAIIFNALLNKEDLWTEAEKTNTYLLLAEKDKTLSALELKQAQSKNYPYLKVNAGYGFNQNRNDLAVYKYQNTLGFNYGVTLGFNIFNGFTRSIEQKNTRIQVKNKELEYDQLSLSIKSDFANMWMAYQNNIELTMLEKENLHNATENYEIAMERYKLGDLSGIELREAQNSLQEAEDRLVTAQYNTKLCEISLLQLSGQITYYLDTFN